MTQRGSLVRIALNALIVSLTAMGSFAGALTVLAPPAAAQTCDQPGSAIVGNWVITTPQICTGIVYTVDGSITINAGGSLTLTNGGLRFSEDTTHIYSLTVNAGGVLILDNSIVTTEPRSLNAYVKLSFTVTGLNARFTMQNGAILKFPGSFSSSANAVITIRDSTITGFLTGDVTSWVGAANADDNDDAPTLTWASSTVDIYNSRIERLFEDAAAISPSPRMIITVAGTTVLNVFNSYIGVDFNADTARFHNEIDAYDTTQVNLLGVTLDEGQSGPQDTWIPPFVPTAGSSANFHFYRWLSVTVTDELGVPASGAGVWSQWGSFRQTAFYPDNGNAPCPGAKILAYLGPTKNCANFNVTDSNGRVLLPLFTDQINTTTTPNAASFGNFEETARVAPFAVSSSVAFDPYPVLTGASESKNLTLAITGLNQPGTVTWASTMTITGAVIPVASSIEITGSVTIIDGGVFLSIQSDACNRAVLKITGTGRLTLIHSTVGSSCPMTLYVGNSGRLIASAGSSLNLDATGRGTLRSDGSSVVTVIDSTIDGDVLAAGSSVSFRRDMFMGTSITINTASRSEIWDANLGPTASIALRSDDNNVNTADFDIRNTSFNAVLTPQLVFGGRQWAQLTGVSLTVPAGQEWWEGMITGNAKVTRYWWLRIDTVDGTGTLLEAANSTVRLRRLDPTTLTWVAIPNPVADDIYYASAPFVWPVSAPLGFVIYRASAEDRYAAPASQWTNSTYLGEASASINLIFYYPDANLTGFIQGDSTITLIFSGLTPEMSVDTPLLYYEIPSNNSSPYPLNRVLNVTAVVHNTGSISVRNSVVSFFSTNVDVNNDGIMDAPKTTYMSADLWIGDYTIPLLPLRSTAVAYVPWMPEGVAESTRPVSVVVDAPISDPSDPGMFRELDETNNIHSGTILLHVWPDLNIGSTDIVSGTAVHDNPTVVTVTVHNDGTNAVTGAYVILRDDRPAPGWTSPPAFFNLGRGLTTSVPITWVPWAPGNHTITAGVYTAALPAPERNIDHNWANNGASTTVNVRTKPDIWLRQSDFATQLVNVTRGFPFNVPITVRNNGDTPAGGFTVSVFLDGVTSQLVGHTDDVAVNGQSSTPITVTVTVNAIGLHTLMIFADSHNLDGTQTTGYGSILESDETNNWANQSVNLVAPRGTIVMTQIISPPNGFSPGYALPVEGFVSDSTTGDGIGGLVIVVELVNPQGAVIATVNTTSASSGSWSLFLTIPQTNDGTHVVRASSTGGTITSATQTIEVRNPGNFLNQLFLGLPVWLWLVIVIIVVVLGVGLTLYFKVYGLGKMVECGECGSFIPEDSTTCPKCGVEFEKDMAKCSNCQAWIPVDVKQCPECGVEFATGKVEMADYQEKMRMQYDEVVAKFREEAQRTLGRSLTEREFQDWWRKQPTFVTFEDWLREEEEMRKMGSKPCPACGTLNSVTATVCHKCGTYLKEERRPPSGGAPPAAQPSGGEAAGAPSEAVPKKVIRKPVAAPPMVQKKVIKKPLGEESQGGGEGSDTQNPPDEEF